MVGETWREIEQSGCCESLEKLAVFGCVGRNRNSIGILNEIIYSSLLTAMKWHNPYPDNKKEKYSFILAMQEFEPEWEKQRRCLTIYKAGVLEWELMDFTVLLFKLSM